GIGPPLFADDTLAAAIGGSAAAVSSPVCNRQVPSSIDTLISTAGAVPALTISGRRMSSPPTSTASDPSALDAAARAISIKAVPGKTTLSWIACSEIQGSTGGSRQFFQIASAVARRRPSNGCLRVPMVLAGSRNPSENQ